MRAASYLAIFSNEADFYKNQTEDFQRKEEG